MDLKKTAVALLIALALSLLMTQLLFSQTTNLGIGLNFVPGIAGLTSRELMARTSSAVIIATEQDATGRMRFKVYERASTSPFPLSTTAAYLVVSPRVQKISLAPSTPPTTPTTDRTRLVFYNGLGKVRVLDTNGTVLTSVDLTIPRTIYDLSRVTNGSAIYVLRSYDQQQGRPYEFFINRYSLPDARVTSFPINVRGSRPRLIMRADGQLHLHTHDTSNPAINNRYSVDKLTGATTAVKINFWYPTAEPPEYEFSPYIRGGREYRLLPGNGVYQVIRMDIETSITSDPNGVWGFTVNAQGTRMVYSTPSIANVRTTVELKSVDIDGSNVVQLTSNTVYDGVQEFLKDGRLLFWSDRLASGDLFIADAADLTKQKLFYRLGPSQTANGWTDQWLLHIMDP